MQNSVTVYLFDIYGTYAGSTQFDPMARVPENATFEAPPAVEVGQYACWNGAAWLVLEHAPVAHLDQLRAAASSAVNAWRAKANSSSFPHAGKQIACDELSRSDIDGVANHIALFGTFPTGFPGGWKAVDNTMVPLLDVDAFRAMYAAMTAQGTENFNHAQELKMRIAAATTPDEIAAIQWALPLVVAKEDA